ncbi:MAG: ribbon-helix-helix protein, CopG family [Parvibaculaceae bacterium]
MNARMPQQMIHTIDRWAMANGLSRSEALRQLLGDALKRADRRIAAASR